MEIEDSELATDGYIDKAGPQALFLFGMLSLIEAMLGVPIDKLAQDLPLPQKILQEYLKNDSYYTALLDLCTAREHADMELLQDSCRRAGVGEKEVAEASVRAPAWADNLSRHIL